MTSKNETGINEPAVSEIYRRVLTGEKLESIKTTEEIKDVIRAFSKYSSLSACQISEKTGLLSIDSRHSMAFSITSSLNTHKRITIYHFETILIK